MRLWATLLLALALTACRSSFYVTKGDERSKQENWAQAIANYDTALNSGAEIDDDYREEIAAKRRLAAGKYTDQLIAQADAQVQGGAYDTAIGQLASVLAAGAFGVDAYKQRIRAALGEVIELRWRQVEVDIEYRRYLAALQTTEWLETMAPDDATLKIRAAKLREDARTFHLQLADGAPPESRLFHLRAVQRLGGTGYETEIAQLLITTTTFARPEYSVILGPGTENKDCRPFLDSLNKILTQSSGGVPVKVKISLEKCAHQEERWTEKEVFSYPSWRAYEENLEESYYAKADEKCPEPKCIRFDPLGTCVERAEAPPCHELVPVLRTRQVPVTRFQSVTSTLSAEVFHRRLASGAKGTFQLEWSGLKREVLLDRIVALEEREVWTPAQSYRFTTTRLEDLDARVANETLTGLGQEANGFRPMLEAQYNDDADKLNARGETRKAEALYIAASLARGMGSPRAEAHFGSQYGLTSYQMFMLLQGQLVRQPAGIPYFQPGNPDYADERYIPVDSYRRRRGAVIAEGGGVDIFANTESSPLNSSKYFSSVGLRIRADNIHLSAEGRSAELAGDSSGFAASLRGVFGDDGYYVLSGVGWDHERADNGERRYFLGFPISFVFPLTRMITMEARIDLNTFALKTLFDDEADDPAYYSPISLRAELDLGGRFYLTGAVRHYLGAGKEHPVDGGLELGLRL